MNMVAGKIRTAGTLLLIAVFGLAATGCGPTAATTAQNYQIRIWRLNQTVDPIQGNIADFQKKYSDVTITYSDKTSVDTYENSAIRSMASESGPDIWSIPDDWLGDENTVTANIPDNFFKDSTASCPNTKNASTNPLCVGAVAAAKLLYPSGIVNQILSTDGTALTGIPTSVDALQLYVNTDILSQAYSDFRKANPNAADSVLNPVKQLLNNPPSTWDDLLSQTQYITQRSGNTVTRSAIALGATGNVPDAADILQLLMLQNGVPVVSSDRTDTLIDSPVTTSSGSTIFPGENALQFYTDFSNPSKANYTWNSSMPSALDAFGQGELAMVIGYSDFGTELAAKYPKMHPTVTSVPQVSLTDPAVNLIQFSTETVAKTANSQNAAFAFLKTYTDSDTVSNLASDLKLRSPYLSTLNNNTGDYFNEEVLTGQAIYKKSRTAFDAAFDQMINDVTQNNVNPQTSINTGAQTLNALLSPSSSN